MTDEGHSVDAAGDNPATPLAGPSKISIVTPAIVDAAVVMTATDADMIEYTITIAQAQERLKQSQRNVPSDRTLQRYCASAKILSKKIATTVMTEHGTESIYPWLINEPSLEKFIALQPTITVDAAGDNPATPLPGPSKISIVTPAIVGGNDDKRQPVGESKGHLFEVLEQRIKDKDELIVILRSELDIKNKQIEKRDTQFDKHLELSTQTNVLLQGFQKLFSEGLFKLLPTQASAQEGNTISENGGVEVQNS